MLLTRRYCVSITLLILLLFGAGQGFAQPLLLNKIVSVSGTNVPVSSILLKLSAETGIRFSYDPAQIAANRKVTLSVTGQKVETVLRTLFNDPELQFKEVGSQVVIFKPKLPAEQQSLSEPDKISRDAQDGKPKPVSTEIATNPKRDTVFISRHDTVFLRHTDTLIITETLVRSDTVRTSDTVYIEKAPPEKASWLSKIPGNPGKQPGSGWFGGISYSWMAGNANYFADSDQHAELADRMKNASQFSPDNFSVGILTGYQMPAFAVETGIAFTRIGERFEYSFTSQTGGYFKSDTVEKYFTLTGTDTSWFFVTDSSWVNIEYSQLSYKNWNSYHYIELPLTFRYRLLSGNRLDVYALAGVIAGFRAGQQALMVVNDNEYSAAWAGKEDLKPLIFSWQAGLGASVPLGENWKWFAEGSFRGQFGSQLKEYPVRKNFNLVNIKTGIFVKL